MRLSSGYREATLTASRRPFLAARVIEEPKRGILNDDEARSGRSSLPEALNELINRRKPFRNCCVGGGGGGTGHSATRTYALGVITCPLRKRCYLSW
jgi:hypothetical protein